MTSPVSLSRLDSYSAMGTLTSRILDLRSRIGQSTKAVSVNRKLGFRKQHFNSLFSSAMPTGTVPVLEIDGKKLDQSIAICRLLAKKVGLSGSTDLENYEIDKVVYTVADLKDSK